MCRRTAGLVLVAAAWAAFGAEAESWAMADFRAWSREKDAVKLSAMTGRGFEVRHTGSRDWCVNGFPQIAVKHGDVFELSCETDALADMPDSRPVGLSVILRDAKGVEIFWSYGEGHAQPGQPIRTAFMVPAGVATVQPRILGGGVTGARVRNVRAVRTGNALPKAGTIADCSFGNGVLRGRVGGAGFEVEDTRTGRTWKPSAGARWTVEELGRRQDADGSVRVDFIQPERVDVQQIQCLDRCVTADRTVAPDQRVVPHTPQQTQPDPRRTSGADRDFPDPVRIVRRIDHLRRAGDDLFHGGEIIVIQPVDRTETRAERCAEQ